MSETGPNPQAAPQPAAMVHFYRGLVDRATTWRGRIDTPTNWAIVLSSTAASFALGDPSHSHAIVLLTILLCCGFWLIEARRYRYYDLWAAWVRLLETDYFAPMLSQNVLMVDQYWHQLIATDIIHPHFKITHREALARRLVHNYLAIFVFLLAIWFLKLWVHPRQPGSTQRVSFVLEASLEPFPGELVMLLVAIFYSGLLLLTLFSLSQRYSRPELLARDAEIWKLVRPISQPVSSRWHARRGRARSRRSRSDLTKE